MIVKFFELKKKNLKEFQFFLLYGNNKGLIEETCNNVIKPFTDLHFVRSQVMTDARININDDRFIR